MSEDHRTENCNNSLVGTEILSTVGCSFDPASATCDLWGGVFGAIPSNFAPLGDAFGDALLTQPVTRSTSRCLDLTLSATQTKPCAAQILWMIFLI